MDRGGWRATVHGVAKEADATERLNNTSTEQSGWLQTRELPLPRDDGGTMLTGWLQTHELPLPQGRWGHHADGVGERSRRCLQLCRPEDLHRDYRTRLPCGKSSQSSHVHKQVQLSIKLYWQREGSGPDVAAAGPMPGVEFS